jgi:hypothetical protein
VFDGSGGRASIQSVKFLAGLEAYGLAGRDADLGTCSWVTPDAGFARANAEDAEAAELDPVACGESILEPFEHCVHGGFCLGTRQACPLNNVMDNILLNQCRRPLNREVFLCSHTAAYWQDAIASWRRCQSPRTPIP